MANPNKVEEPFVNDIGQTLNVGDDVITFTSDYRCTVIKAGKFLGVKMGPNPYLSFEKQNDKNKVVVGLYIGREHEKGSLIGNCMAYLPNTTLKDLNGKRV